MLSWTEHDLWNAAEFGLAWRIETHAFTEAVNCNGKNRFIADGNSTIIESRGELTIDPTRIKGVPIRDKLSFKRLVVALALRNCQAGLTI